MTLKPKILMCEATVFEPKISNEVVCYDSQWLEQRKACAGEQVADAVATFRLQGVPSEIKFYDVTGSTIGDLHKVYKTWTVKGSCSLPL